MAGSNRSVFLDSTGRRRRWLSWTTIIGATVVTIAAAGFFSALLLSHPSAPTLPLAAVMRAVPQVKTPATDAERLALEVSDREQELARETRIAAAKPKARVADPSGKPLSYDQHEEGSDAGSIASQDWFETVLDKRMATLDPAKTIIGLGSYAYDWTKGSPTQELTLRLTSQAARGSTRRASAAVDASARR